MDVYARARARACVCVCVLHAYNTLIYFQKRQLVGFMHFFLCIQHTTRVSFTYQAHCSTLYRSKRDNCARRRFKSNGVVQTDVHGDKLTVCPDESRPR